MTRKVLNGLDLGNQRIVSLADPSSSTDAATKAYVDQVARGLNWKQSVRAATTTSGTLASAYENGDVIDGVTLTTGDRILLKDQSSATENGIYVVAATGAPARATDMPAGSDGKGVAVTVTSGSVNADRVYIQTADTATVGTDALSWSQLGGGGSSYTAGDGLAESPAGTFNVATGTGLEVSADAVRIAAAAAGAGLTGGAGSALAVGAGNGITVNADDVALASSTAGAGLTYTSGVLAVGAGTGISVAADAVAVDTAVVSRHVAANVGDNAATQIDVTHNLGTYDVSVEVFVNSGSRETVICDVSRTDTNTVRLNFATAPTSGQFRVVVQG
ncbi:hypothetical protein ACLQ2R_17335 [Streptosporangium sp. DT93]|uniref:hypothetical protein n=1 Tax=Streptosporangium sp. DT93 TaxID=3393428 RepID=UPI003CF687A3